MTTKQLPGLITTSVVRGSEKGQSHGGVYTIDFNSQEVLHHIDWNTSDIDFSGRGWDRGLRGIEFTDSNILLAASDELFFYSAQFEQQESYSNRYLKHCHEICRRDNLLFMTSTGYDSLLAFDLQSRTFVWGLYITRNGQQWVGQPFDPRTAGGPALSNNYHINMVHVEQSGLYFSGLYTRALLRLDGATNITEVCNLPEKCHNARPFRDGILFNDTANDVVRFVGRDGRLSNFKIQSYDSDKLEYTGVDDSRIARQAFGRGLCVIDDQYIAAGSSPSTISLYDLHSQQRVAAVNLTMDIRNAIHGLEVWPFTGAVLSG